MRIVLNAETMPFSLDHTLRCGQLFRWEKRDTWWYGVVQERLFKVKQVGRELYFKGVDESFLRNYFGLDDDLPLILSKIDRDEHIGKAVQQFCGLRIVRQEPWECLVSYICATYKNIPAIKNMIHNLSKRFGQRKVFENREFYTFPRANRLADAGLEELENCNLGFRAKYVLQTSRIVASGEFSFNALGQLGYEEAKERLVALPGVGQKVADCVLLFSLGRLEAFPVDVWIKRLILAYYKNHFDQSFIRRISKHGGLSSSEYLEISSFGRSYFGEYAGYAQEYLFHYGRYFFR